MTNEEKYKEALELIATTWADRINGTAADIRDIARAALEETERGHGGFCSCQCDCQDCSVNSCTHDKPQPTRYVIDREKLEPEHEHRFDVVVEWAYTYMGLPENPTRRNPNDTPDFKKAKKLMCSIGDCGQIKTLASSPSE
jgi:hypothetical protein